MFTKNTCIARQLQQMLLEEYPQEETKMILRNCASPKIRLLWDIFFETGMEETDRLEEEIYRFGSMVKEKDYLSREIFLGMVALLREIKQLPS